MHHSLIKNGEHFRALAGIARRQGMRGPEWDSMPVRETKISTISKNPWWWWCWWCHSYFIVVPPHRASYPWDGTNRRWSCSVSSMKWIRAGSSRRDKPHPVVRSLSNLFLMTTAKFQLVPLMMVEVEVVVVVVVEVTRLASRDKCYQNRKLFLRAFLFVVAFDFDFGTGHRLQKHKYQLETVITTYE